MACERLRVEARYLVMNLPLPQGSFISWYFQKSDKELLFGYVPLAMEWFENELIRLYWFWLESNGPPIPMPCLTVTKIFATLSANMDVEMDPFWRDRARTLRYLRVRLIQEL